MSVNSKMTAIANAIRSLLGITGTLGLDAMATKLNGIAKRTASNLSASGKTVTVPAGYYASQVTKDVATATQATPSISVDSAGKITASATQSAGYVAAGTKTGTKQLTTQAAKTITPGTSGQTAIAAGTYATGAVIVAGDANLVPANIVEGKSIFGKTGTAEPAAALDDELTEQDSLISQIMAALEGKTGGASVDTCTVRIESSSVRFRYGCTVYRDGAITTDYIEAPERETVTISDVVCGSGLCLWGGTTNPPTVTNATIHFFTFADFDGTSVASLRIDAPAGGTATITV